MAMSWTNWLGKGRQTHSCIVVKRKEKQEKRDGIWADSVSVVNFTFRSLPVGRFSHALSSCTARLNGISAALPRPSIFPFMGRIMFQSLRNNYIAINTKKDNTQLQTANPTTPLRVPGSRSGSSCHATGGNSLLRPFPCRTQERRFVVL
jgi:hypothetical protein